MLALGLLALSPLLIWLGQSAILYAAGLPLRWRISSADMSRQMKLGNRIVLNAVMGSVLLAYPLLRGSSPLEFYAAFFPLGLAPSGLWRGAAMSVLYLSMLYATWALTDNVRCGARHPAAVLVPRLLAVPLMAIGAATIEELMFRAMLLSGLLETFPQPAALSIGVIVFAVAHYIRRVKRYWTFPGHLTLGALLCVAFSCTHTLWLPIGLHAGGIVMLMGLRPFLRYTGPPWLVGGSIYPYAGVVGIAALGLLTVNVWLAFGGAE